MPASTSSKMSVRARRRLERGDAEREHDARQLAAGRDPRQRPEVLAGIRREEELDVVDAARASTRRRASRAATRTSTRHAASPGRPGRASSARPSRRGRASRRRDSRAPRLEERSRALRARRARARATLLFAGAERGQLVAERRCAREHVVERRPVLPLQALERRQPIFDGLQPIGRRVEVARVSRRKNARSSSARLHVVALLEVRHEPRVERRQVADALPDRGRARRAPRARRRRARRRPRVESRLSRSALASTRALGGERVVFAGRAARPCRSPAAGTTRSRSAPASRDRRAASASSAAAAARHCVERARDVASTSRRGVEKRVEQRRRARPDRAASDVRADRADRRASRPARAAPRSSRARRR